MFKPKLIFFASSSSVYGDQKKMPLTENTATDKPKSFYAATKKCNEIMSYSYSELYKLNIIGLRFFTVYGPYGRPDMTPYSFLIKHFKNKFINIFNYGNHKRDFTYIDDAINSIISLFKVFEKKKKLVSYFEIFNIARGNSKKLMDYIKLIELNIGKKIKKKFIKKQKGDVDETFASTKKVNKIINYKPKYNIENGIKKFVDWFKLFHNLKK
jgi:UDP-glucuronate 4-epimerase